MLTLEQVKKLAGWGLPQELKWGNWYYVLNTDLAVGTHGVEFDTKYVRAMKRNYGDSPASDLYYKIPDLEELMEFARFRCSNKWALHPGITYMVIGQLGDYEDEDPKQAIFQMCEYYFEERKDER